MGKKFRCDNASPGLSSKKCIVPALKSWTTNPDLEEADLEEADE